MPAASMWCRKKNAKADASKKYKCKDYVVIGDPANELKKDQPG